MKKTALLIDGGWFRKGLGKILNLPNGWPPATTVVKNAKAALEADEELFRISGDTDMIPAMKLARREGLQVFVVKLDPWKLNENLIEDSDGVRVLKPTP